MPTRRGRKSAAQTPAPKSEQIKGSKKNPRGSAASEKSAAKINLSSQTIDTLKKKLEDFKEENPTKKNVSLNDLKAVYRRGSGAYSSSHRPTITGGKPNSRAAWSFARVNKFLEKAAGKPVKKAYIQDDDLLFDRGGKIEREIEFGIKSQLGEEYVYEVPYRQIKKHWLKLQEIFSKNNIEFEASEGYKTYYIDAIVNDSLAIFVRLSTRTLPSIFSEYSLIEWAQNENGQKIIDINIMGSEDFKTIVSWFKSQKTFKDGGAVDSFTGKPIKKMYVSIPINYDLQEYTDEDGKTKFYIEKLDDAPFKNLSAGVLQGISGVSSSRMNVGDWFTRRDCLIVMPFQEFSLLNNAEQIQYDDANYLMKNNMDAVFRLYNRKKKNIDTTNQIMSMFLSPIAGNFFKLGKSDVHYEEIGYLFQSDAFRRFILKKGLDPEIENFSEYDDSLEWDSTVIPSSVEQLADYAIEFAQRPDKYKYRNSEPFYIDKEDLIENLKIPIIDQMAVYANESEWVLVDKRLVIPSGSQIFFRLHAYPNYLDKLEEYIDEYKLREKYKVYFVKSQYLDEFHLISKRQEKLINKQRTERIKDKVEQDVREAVMGTIDQIKNDFRVLLEEEQKTYTIRDRNRTLFYVDSKGNKYDSFLELPEVIALNDLLLSKINVILLDAAEKSIQNKDKSHLSQVGSVIENRLDNFANTHGYKKFEAKNEWGEEPDYYELIGSFRLVIYKMLTENYFRKYADSVRTKLGRDWIRLDEEMNFEGGGDIAENLKNDYMIIECVGCGWSWDERDSDPSDVYVCHKCNFDNSLFYDGGILKPTKTVGEIAELHSVDENYLMQQLEEGIKHELEHTSRPDVAEKIALHHLEEMPDYYERLKLIEAPVELDMLEFLLSEKEEADEVRICSDGKIYKVLMCKAKIDVAENRMGIAETAEEKNLWNECIWVWKNCLSDILENNNKFKHGGQPCGCGKKYSKGGLAYGNSHDKGGIPLTVKSTGQNIEIEGGEGVINKRSMQMTKKLEFQGQKLTPCQIISKINEMGGGVKFKCDDVAEIIAEDGHF